MGRLDQCLDIHNAPKELVDHIMRERQKYLDDGYSATDAKIKAVEDILGKVDDSIENIVNALPKPTGFLNLNPENRAANLGINEREKVLDELYDGIGDNLGRLQSKGILKIVSTIEEAAGEPVYSIDGVPVAFYEDGTITLIASNIPKGEAKAILMHEGFHFAMANDPILISIHENLLYEFGEMIGKSKAVDAAFRMVPKDTPKALINEEAFAYFLQNKQNRKTNLFRKVIANIKAFLVRMGLDPKSFSEEDFVAIAEQSIAAAFRMAKSDKKAPRAYSKSTRRGEQISRSEDVNARRDTAPAVVPGAPVEDVKAELQGMLERKAPENVERELQFSPADIKLIKAGKLNTVSKGFPIQEGFYRLNDGSVVEVVKVVKEKNQYTATFKLEKAAPYVSVYNRIRKQRIDNPDTTVLHSGGAIGADEHWGIAARKNKMLVNHYAWDGHTEKKPAFANQFISSEELEQFDFLLYRANDKLKRTFPAASEETNNLLRRNIFQVKNSKTIFAVSTLNDKRTQVDGGTGWAVQVAIDLGKPVYVFDQKIGQWFTYDEEIGKFIPSVPVVIPKDFAGIGTRKLNDKGKNAIYNLFSKVKKDRPVDESKLSREELKKWENEKRALMDSYFKGGLLEKAEEREAFVAANSRVEVLRHYEAYRRRNGLDESEQVHLEDFEIFDYMDRFFADENVDNISDATRGAKLKTDTIDPEAYFGENISTETGSAALKDEMKWSYIQTIDEKLTQMANELDNFDVDQARATLLERNRNTLHWLYRNLLGNDRFKKYDVTAQSIEEQRARMDKYTVTKDMTKEEKEKINKERMAYVAALKSLKRPPDRAISFENALKGELTVPADYVIFTLSPFMETHDIRQILNAVEREEGSRHNWRSFPEALTDIAMFLNEREYQKQEALNDSVNEWLQQDQAALFDYFNTDQFSTLRDALDSNALEVYKTWQELNIPQRVMSLVRELGFEAAVEHVHSNPIALITLENKYGISEQDAKTALDILTQVFWTEGVKNSRQFYSETGRKIQKEKPAKRSAVSAQAVKDDPFAHVDLERTTVYGKARLAQMKKEHQRQQQLLEHEWKAFQSKSYRATASDIRGVLGAIQGMAVGQKEANFTIAALAERVINDKKISEDFKTRVEAELIGRRADKYNTLKNIVESLNFITDWWPQQYSGLPTAEAKDQLRLTMVDEQEAFIPQDTDKLVRRMVSASYIRHDNQTGESYTVSYEYGDSARAVLQMADDRGLIEEVVLKNFPKEKFGWILKRDGITYEQFVQQKVREARNYFHVGYAEFLLEEAEKNLADAREMETGSSYDIEIKNDKIKENELKIARYKHIINNLDFAKKMTGIENIKKNGKTIEIKTFKEMSNAAKSKLNFNLLDYKAIIAADIIANDIPMDAQFFQDMAKKHPELGLSAMEIFGVYKKAMNDPVRFTNLLEKMRLDKSIQEGLMAYEGLITEGVPLTAAARDAIRNKVATEIATSPYVKGSKADQYFKQLILSEMYRSDQNSIPDLTSAKDGYVDTRELVYAHPDPDPTSPWYTKVHFRRDQAKLFYQAFANDLNVDLVVTADMEFDSQFVPGENGQRDQIIINVNRSPNTGKILAQEAFYRVLNNLDPKTRNYILSEISKLSEPLTRHKYEMMGEGPLQSITSAYEVSKDENAFDAKINKLQERNPTLTEEQVQMLAAAEIFAFYAPNPSFSKALVEAINDHGEAKDAIGRAYIQLIGNLNKLSSLQKEDTSATMYYENKKLVSSPDVDMLYELAADMIGGTALREKTLSSDNGSTNRLYAKMGGQATTIELKNYMQKPIKPVHGFWKKLFSPETKNYRDVMTNIEQLLTGLFEWIKRNKTKAAFADYRANPVDTKLASYVNHGMEQAAYKMQMKLQKYKNAFKGMSEDNYMELHDRISRGLIVVDGKKQKVGPLDFRKAEDVRKAKSEGISDEIIEVYKIYMEESDRLYDELKKYYPDLPHNKSHYGQSIKWLKLNGQDVDTEFMQLLYPERSEALGRTQFLKEKNKDYTTKEIAKASGSKPLTMNPHAMMLDYVRDASKVIMIHKMINDGIILGRVRFFKNGNKNIPDNFLPVDDPAFEILSEGDTKYRVLVDGVVQMDKEGYEYRYPSEEEAQLSVKEKEGQTVTVEEVKQKDRILAGVTVFEKDGTKIKNVGTFQNQTLADEFIKAQPEGKTYTSVRKYDDVSGRTVVGRYYFAEDLAHELRTIFAKDRFRDFEFGALTGKRLLRIKNFINTINFAFSMFHMMTISQEHLAWSMGLKMQKEKGFVNKAKSIMNPYSVFMDGLTDARDIRVLFDEYHKNPDLAKDPAFIKKFQQATGTSNFDVVDALEKFFMVGGLPNQDPSLRADAHYFGKIRYSSTEPELVIENGEAKIVGADLGPIKNIADIAKSVVGSVKEAHKTLTEQYPDKPVANMFKTMQFSTLEASTAWLMEQVIPKLKMAMYFKTYAHKVAKYSAEIEAGTMLKEQIAHDTMKFVEDCFGEVNWKNQWMVPTYKSALIFMFRSFTWFTGSWKALSKAGVDVGKLLWFRAKGEHYELTEKGWWGVNAVLAHLLVAGAVTVAYKAIAGLGGDETPDDEDVDLLSRMLFPRINPQDPYDRITIPSYITEGYKIFHHLGILGNNFEPFKLISGRFNDTISNAAEAISGRDFRGVEIRNSHDPLAKQALDSALHIMAVAPIAVSSIMDDWRREGFRPEKVAIGFLGITDAPAVAKRSSATSYAYELTRKKFSSMTTTEEDAARRDEVSRAAVQYSKGNREPLNQMLYRGEIGIQTYRNALERLQRIDNKPNPMYKKPLASAMDRLSIEEAIDVWGYMTPAEQETMKPILIRKYMNTLKRKARGELNKQEIFAEMKKLGIF